MSRQTGVPLGLSGSTLKLIAIVTMLIDHFGYAVIGLGVLAPNGPQLSREQWQSWAEAYKVLRTIGRISFPIFAFLLVEGFLHTKHLASYGKRLFCFALLSEVPFDLAFNGAWLEFGSQNIYFTLFLGLMALVALERFPGLGGGAIALLCGLAALFLRTDYDMMGVMLIVVLYLFRFSPLRTLAGCLFFLDTISAMFAFIPINLYNGKQGWRLKYVFYLFYPVHLLVLTGVRMWFITG